MAIIARFSFDVPFGKKPDLLKLMKKLEPMEREFGLPETGRSDWIDRRSRVARRIQPSLREPGCTRGRLAKLGGPAMADYQKEMAPLVVPGSHRWEILRIQDDRRLSRAAHADRGKSPP